MPVAVRLIEILAIVALVATMAAGAAVVIFLEKLLLFLLLITEPLIAVVNFLLVIFQYIFLVSSLSASLGRAPPQSPSSPIPETDKETDVNHAQYDSHPLDR